MVPEKVEANEGIRETQRALGLGDGEPLPFLCECDDVRCRALIRLTSTEYADARASTTRCLVVEGHPYEGRIVQSGHGYVIAEK